jgi:phage-related protein
MNKRVIRESQLAAIVLDDLRRVTHFARQQEALFVQHINQRNSAETKREIDRLQRELDAMRRRDMELTALFKRLYEDNVLGRISVYCPTSK